MAMSLSAVQGHQAAKEKPQRQVRSRYCNSRRTIVVTMTATCVPLCLELIVDPDESEPLVLQLQLTRAIRLRLCCPKCVMLG